MNIFHSCFSNGNRQKLIMFKIQQKKEENTHTYTHIHRQRQTDRQTRGKHENWNKKWNILIDRFFFYLIFILYRRCEKRETCWVILFFYNLKSIESGSYSQERKEQKSNVINKKWKLGPGCIKQNKPWISQWLLIWVSC